MAAMLKHAAPREFEQFVKVFSEYNASVTAAVVEAQQGDILRCQGHAQQCLALERAFIECETVYAQHAAAASNPRT